MNPKFENIQGKTGWARIKNDCHERKSDCPNFFGNPSSPCHMISQSSPFTKIR